MLISFIFSYSEKFFVVFYSSFYFVLGQGPSARGKADLPDSFLLGLAIVKTHLFKRQHMFYMQNTMGACRCRGRAVVMC